jgi:hypothetical protein
MPSDKIIWRGSLNKNIKQINMLRPRLKLWLRLKPRLMLKLWLMPKLKLRLKPWLMLKPRQWPKLKPTHRPKPSRIEPKRQSSNQRWKSGSTKSGCKCSPRVVSLWLRSRNHLKIRLQKKR